MTRVLPLVIGIVAGLLAPSQAAPRLLFDGPRSDYGIYLGPGAPPSVQQAAAEIRRVVKAAGGPEL
ncbi:MAG: hypothetical protein HUU35_03485, partial [Armatimonadetes bacterium]|nr:hypothetical protein [Armatimonadota bacterium]